MICFYHVSLYAYIGLLIPLATTISQPCDLKMLDRHSGLVIKSLPLKTLRFELENAQIQHNIYTDNEIFKINQDRFIVSNSIITLY